MGQGVVYGQHGAEGIPLEKTGAQGRLGVEVQREGEEGAVHLAPNEHGLHGAVFQIKRELNIHLGIELQKGADNLRQPLDSDAVEGAHTDGAPLQTQQLIHRVFQLPLGGAYGADAGKQVLALGRETDADPPADQKRNAPFALQIGDDPAHRGLRIAEKFGRLRDVSQLYGFQKDLIFG